MFCDRRLANVERWSIDPPEDAAMMVRSEVRECVVFLGSPGEVPDSTAFLVSYPIDPIPEVVRSYYLVTAAHCVPKSVPRTIRVNLLNGTARIAEAPQRWWRHPTDATVDVAVAPVPRWQDAAVKHIPTEMFARPETFEDQGVGPGDEVFITGLFADAHGTRRNLPIVRTGNIARLADDHERIQTEWGNVAVHLIEARSRGGLSGSPVFTRRTTGWRLSATIQKPQPDPMELLAYGPELFFLGLVHGHWDDAGRPDDEINMGLAFVVPAQHVLETLDHPDLVAQRAELVTSGARVIARLDEGDQG